MKRFYLVINLPFFINNKYQYLRLSEFSKSFQLVNDPIKSNLFVSPFIFKKFTVSENQRNTDSANEKSALLSENTSIKLS
jgi:hypothetical protein